MRAVCRQQKLGQLMSRLKKVRFEECMTATFSLHCAAARSHSCKCPGSDVSVTHQSQLQTRVYQ